MNITKIAISIFLLAVIILIIVFKREKFTKKNIRTKIFIIILVLICCSAFGIYFFSQRSSNFIFVKTTTLKQENIDGLKMYESIDSREFVKKYGTNLKKINNALFEYYRLSNGLEIATNKQRQIIRIIVSMDTNSGIKTNKGIGVGSGINDVIKVYGTNYYKRNEEQMPSSPVIGYVDHKREVTIEFWNVKNKVAEIRYDIASIE